MKKNREREVEVVELPFDTIRPSVPEMVYGLLRVGQDSDGYEYYTSANGKRYLLSLKDSKLGIARIKERSKSMNVLQAEDVEKLPNFLKSMSVLCAMDDIVGLSIFRHKVRHKDVFNAEVYNDYTVEESLAAEENVRSI